MKERSSTNFIKQWNIGGKRNLFDKNVGKNNDQHPSFPMVSADHREKGKKNLKLFTYKMNK